MANQSSLPFFWREGESEKLWKDPGRTIERARKERQAEAERAANILGVVDIEFFNLGITLCVRTRSPGKTWPIFSLCCARLGCLRTRSMILTISTAETARLCQEARNVAQTPGRKGPAATIGTPPIFLFEPHQPEQCSWRPELILDVSNEAQGV